MLACGRAAGAAGMLERLGTGVGLRGGVGRAGGVVCKGGEALRLINSSLAVLVAVAATAIPEASNAPTASATDLLSFELTFRMFMFPSVNRR